MANTSILTELPFCCITNSELTNLFSPVLSVSERFQDNNFYQYIKSVGDDELLQKLNFKYVTSEDFTVEINRNNGEIELSLFHLNVRSLNKNSAEISAFLNSLALSFDVIVLSEIWSTNIDLYHTLFVDYDFYYDLPETGIVGGVGVYVKSSLEHSLIDDYKITDCKQNKVENLWLAIKKNSRKYVIGGLYRHPDQDITSFAEKLNNLCYKIQMNKLPCIIAGDINIDLSKYEAHPNTKNYVDNLISNNFLPAIMMPTRITCRSATTIDHIYYSHGTNINNDVTVKSGNIWCDITDHLPNYMFFINSKIESKNNNKNIERPLVRIFSAKNIQKFKYKVSIIDWAKLYQSNDADSAYLWFSEALKKCYDDSFPLVRVSRKRSNDKQWITAGIKCSSHHKNKLYTKWLRSRNLQDEINYKNYRKLFKQTVKNAEIAYYKERFDTKVNTVKQLWTNLNNLLANSNKKKIKIDKLQIDSKIITNPQDICNSLNKYFSSVGDVLSKTLKKCNENDFLKYCSDSSKDSMYCDTVNADEIVRIITGFLNNKSPGMDGISPKLLKEITYDIANPLVFIFNLSFSTGIVPDSLKISKVIPLFKKGRKDMTTNYRPISLLSVFDKIMEKLMYSRLYSYLNSKSLLYDYQFGFRKNHSTTLALLEVIDDIYSHLDKHETTVGIYLDLQKAFDCVNHKILLKKLYNYGIRGTVHAWFQSYLTNRQQVTSLHDVCSNFESVTCGVPQGSVLGPLLFLIYVNDIQHAVGNTKIKLFADDTNVFLHGKILTELGDEANKILKQLHDWCTANKLCINVDKTCYSVFGAKNEDMNLLTLKINDTVIKNVQSGKYLGIMIDNQLTWQDHIDSVYKKIIRFTSIFYKIRSMVSKEVLRIIYFAFVHPHLLYGIEIYGNTYPTHLSKLMVLNNKLLRIIQNKPLATPVSDLYVAFNTLTLPFLHDFQVLRFVHKFLFNRGKLPAIFSSYFTENRLVHSYDTRQKSDFHVGSVQTAAGKRSISFKGCTLWNNLPIEFKTIKSAMIFKTKLRSHYFTLME